MNGYELLAEFDRVIKEVILVPNAWLPEYFRDNRTDGVTLIDLETKCNNLDMEETDHQKEKREKEKRVQMYREMIDRGEEISYLTKGGVA